MNNYVLGEVLVKKIGGRIERCGRMVIHIAQNGLRSHVRFTTGTILFRQPKTGAVSGVFFMDHRQTLCYQSY